MPANKASELHKTNREIISFIREINQNISLIIFSIKQWNFSPSILELQKGETQIGIPFVTHI